ncbi:MAG: DUF1080 domain-containing protein, partial [Verrucomicrobiota bacterium]
MNQTLLAFTLPALLLTSLQADHHETSPADDAESWISLFDGQSLNGWSIKSGFATYRVEDGAIVGKTAEGSKNTFLCSEEEFADFELEFEVMVDDGLNSGVQIRSQLATLDKKGG